MLSLRYCIASYVRNQPVIISARDLTLELLGGRIAPLHTAGSYTRELLYWDMHMFICHYAVAFFFFMSTFMYAVTQFHSSTVTVNAENVGGTTPGVRVTWNITIPPEWVASVRVEFRTS